ncbi:MAG: BTAD domain-containing putative transcriptional regulator [Actinomycetota bacterium]|nr:BTAD domain-containing putative transcriptional regulator [Actinomycetota bacterium]
MPSSFSVALLGPMTVALDGRSVALGGRRQRTLFALLVVARGSSVPLQRIVDTLWPDGPPQSTRASIQSHVSRLRRALGDAGDRIELGPYGYRLEIAADELDLAGVEATIDEATAAMETDPTVAAALFEEALGRWRGDALAEFADSAELQPEWVRIAELRHRAGDLLLEALLDAGRHEEELPRLKAAASAEPLRERTHCLLMTALYRCGQHHEALRVAEGYRRRLADETGLDPTDELASLESDILARTVAAAPPSAMARSGLGVDDTAIARPDTVAGHAAGPGTNPGDASDGGRDRATRSRAPRLAPPPNAFVGRLAESTRLREALMANRCITVTGLGGAGKTRLVAELLAAEPALDPVVVLLSGIDDPSDVVHALANQLVVRLPENLGAADAVVDSLHDNPRLLVLDNCEHVLDEVRPLVDRILRSTDATVLATSRERLAVAGEQVVALGPLGASPDRDPDGPSDAALLFVDRARRVRPDFTLDARNESLIEDLVERLDSLPLAIELAASRLATFDLRELRSRLDLRLDLLASPGADSPRTATLRGVVEWSYRLLDEDAQELFDELSIFDGGFALDAAEHVALGRRGRIVAITLARLVEASMVVADDHELGRRYRLLETMRHFGRERLDERDQLGAMSARHASWAADLAERIQQGLATGDEPVWAATAMASLDDLRIAHRWSLREGTGEEAVRISLALDELRVWHLLDELIGWSIEIGERARRDSPPWRGVGLGLASHALRMRGDEDASEAAARDGLDGAEPGSEAWTICRDALGWPCIFWGRFAEAHDHFAAAATGRSSRLPGDLLARAGLCTAYAGDHAGAMPIVDRAAAAAGAAGSPSAIAFTCWVRGEIGRLTDDPAAIDHLRKANELARWSGAAMLEHQSAITLAVVAADHGDPTIGAALIPDALRFWRRVGYTTLQWRTIRMVSVLCARLGRPEEAARLFGACEAARAPKFTERDTQWFGAIRDGLEQQLGPERFAQLLDEGARVSRPAAVELALVALVPQDATAGPG